MPFTFHTTKFADAQLIVPQIFGDERGFFLETYRYDNFAQAGITNTWIQDNHSKSNKGILRGLHIQTQHTQAKLVRVTQGMVYDVIVDARLSSPTYGQRQGFELSGENQHMLYIPKGFLHGFINLVDGTEFLYKCDDIYDPSHESGVMWDDQILAIDWGKYLDGYNISQPLLGSKDQKNLDWKTFNQTYSHLR